MRILMSKVTFPMTVLPISEVIMNNLKLNPIGSFTIIQNRNLM